MKSYFILHNDSLSIMDKLSDEQNWKLLRLMRSYHNWENYVPNDFVVEIAFEQFKNQFDRDSETHRKMCEKNSLNWAKWWRPRIETQGIPENPVGYLGLQNNPENPDGAIKKNKNNNKNNKEEVIVSEKELRDWVDNWASNRFNSDTKINPTVLRTIISMMDIWFIVDKTEKRLQEIKVKLCDKMRLYYTLWDGTLQLIKFEDEVWKRKEHWRENPPQNHLNSLWNRLIPYEVRNPKK